MKKEDTIRELEKAIIYRKRMIAGARAFELGKIYHIQNPTMHYDKSRDGYFLIPREELVKVKNFNGDSIRFMILASTDRDLSDYTGRKSRNIKNGQIFDTANLAHDFQAKDLPLYMGHKYVSPYFSKILKGDVKCPSLQ